MTLLRVRKKPVAVDAMLYSGSPASEREILAWIKENSDRKAHLAYIEPGGSAVGIAIPTLEGRMMASPGDYIIRGVKGEFYPCKPDIFHATYEVVGNLDGHCCGELHPRGHCAKVEPCVHRFQNGKCKDCGAPMPGWIQEADR